MLKAVSLVGTIGLFVFASEVCGADPLLQLEVDRVKHEGRLEARTDTQAWLMNRSGELLELQLAKVKNVKRISPQFSALTVTMLNTQLKREFGRDMEVRNTRHYIVVAPKGRAIAYAELFEDIYRTFYMHFSIRGFRIKDPEFPLVALVFPNHSQFAAYARTDNVDARPGLMGYYMRTTNRVALFEGKSPRKSNGNLVPFYTEELDLRNKASQSIKRDTSKKWGRIACGHFIRPLLNQVDSQSSLSTIRQRLHSSDESWHGAIEGDLRDTLIHEATHQVAFNVGLHIRLGDNPKWIVEGLATVFEAEGIRNSSKGRSAKHRINRDRFIWFQNYSAERFKAGALERFLRNDSMFKSQTLDAYAFSWALSFFLIETRPRQYTNLLKELGSRDALTVLSENARLQMFKRHIGSNLRLLESELLRFYKRLK